MAINRRLLPMKGHFFLFNAGTAPVVPYLSSYARQLGFTSHLVGIIYTILPIAGLIAKPLFGAIADRFRLQKFLFIAFEIMSVVAFASIYFVPGKEQPPVVGLSCADGATFMHSCYSENASVNHCDVEKVIHLSQNSTVNCEMSCEMYAPEMWRTVCEHWHMPQYCYADGEAMRFGAKLDVRPGSVKRDNASQCLNLYAPQVDIEGTTFNPVCSVYEGRENRDVPCTLQCTGRESKDRVVRLHRANMTCVDSGTHFALCDPDADKVVTDMRLFDDHLVDCEVNCNVSKAWRVMEICEGWGADLSDLCRPQFGGKPAPDTLQFRAQVPLHMSLVEGRCLYLKIHALQSTLANDNGEYFPYCPSQVPHQTNRTFFQSSCNISCDDIAVNEMLLSAIDSHPFRQPLDYQFWVFLFLMVVGWVSVAVVVSISDAICFDILGDKPSAYGRQRMWGSLGWGCFSLLTGSLIDKFSDGGHKDYTVAFVLMAVFLLLDVAVSSSLHYKSRKMSMSLASEMGKLLSSAHTVVFLLWAVCVGLCTGLLWQFLFWHLEDVAGGYGCASAAYVKTLQGLVSATQCFAGEIPFMFLSGPILKRIGHVNMMSVVLFAFGARFLLYSALANPWWVLPIELLQGVTFGMFYPTMTSYASIVAPPGTEATVQGLVGAAFEGIGTALGSFIGGQFYDSYGGTNTFRYFGVGVIAVCLVHVCAQWWLQRHAPPLTVMRQPSSNEGDPVAGYPAPDNQQPVPAK